MGLQLVALCRQGDVDQVLIVQKGREDGYEVGLVVVPPQTELLHRHGDLDWAAEPANAGYA